MASVCRTSSVRVGFVLDRKSEAFKKLAQPIKLGVGSPLGSGEQYISWVHLKDLVGAFVKVLEDNSIDGVVNGCGPNPITQKELTQAIAKSYKKPLFSEGKQFFC